MKGTCRRLFIPDKQANEKIELENHYGARKKGRGQTLNKKVAAHEEALPVVTGLPSFLGH